MRRACPCIEYARRSQTVRDVSTCSEGPFVDRKMGDWDGQSGTDLTRYAFHQDLRVPPGVFGFRRSRTAVARHSGHHHEGVCTWIELAMVSMPFWSRGAASPRC